MSVTDDDEVNIRSALLAKRNGAGHAVALVNIPGFIPLVAALGVDAVINPSQITVSSILEHVRRGKIRDVHPVIEDLGEVIEAEALPSAAGWQIASRGKNFKGVAIGGIMRDELVMPARGDTVIEAGDTVTISLRAARSRWSKSCCRCVSISSDICRVQPAFHQSGVRHCVRAPFRLVLDKEDE